MKRLRHGWAVLMAGLLLVGMLIQVRGSVVASSVSVTGLGAADATVTDSSGKDVTHNTELDRRLGKNSQFIRRAGRRIVSDPSPDFSCTRKIIPDIM